MKEPTTESEVAGAYAASKDSTRTGHWLVDSGASSHMTRDKELLADYKELEIPEKVSLGDGHMVDAHGVGNVHLNMVFEGGPSKKFVMYRVLYVPQLASNLFSVRAAALKGSLVTPDAGSEIAVEYSAEWDRWSTSCTSWIAKFFALSRCP